ncbi:MAG TPA: response regulator, partial [Thermoanaerobaculia bacterium]|nr:response regulator [Thermoanaerobaculia bacterium]
MQPDLREIVLIEDSEHDRLMSVRALRRRHVANPVRELRDGEEAMLHFFGEGVDREAVRRRTCVVLLDLKLPRVDGAEILRRLKSDPVLRVLPVVVLTSSAEESDRLASYDTGANSYIVKPIDFDAFAGAISELGFYWGVLNANADGPNAHACGPS